MTGFLSVLIQRTSGQALAIKPLVRSSYDAPPPMKESATEFEETVSFDEESHPTASPVAPKASDRGQPPTARRADTSEAKELVRTGEAPAVEAKPDAHRHPDSEADQPSAARPQQEDRAVPAGSNAASDKPEVVTSTVGRNARQTPDTPRKRGIEVRYRHEGGRHPAPVSRQQETAAPGSKNARGEGAQPVRSENGHATERADTGERDTGEAPEIALVTSPGNGLPARVSSRQAAAPPVELVRRYQPEMKLSQRQAILPARAEIPPAPETSSSKNIRVTIGRVEIKAVRQPERPVQRSAPARKGPAVSLDTYLRGRDGERQ